MHSYTEMSIGIYACILAVNLNIENKHHFCVVTILILENILLKIVFQHLKKHKHSNKNHTISLKVYTGSFNTGSYSRY